MRRFVRLLLLPTLVSAAHATVFAPMDDAALVASSRLVVTGNVTRVRSVEAPGGRLVTRTRLAVDRVLVGRLARPSITITTAGGQVGARFAVVFGTPAFAVGEPVLVFLQRTRRGELRPSGLALGVYRLTTAVDGTLEAARLAPFHDVRPLATLAASIGAASVRLPDAPAAAAAPVPVSAPFTFLGPPFSRWFEPDSGQPVRYRIANADVVLGQPASNQVIDRATAAWTNVPTATIVIERSGSTSPAPSVAGGVCDGHSTVQFNDPFGEISPLSGCGGVLAVGGYCGSDTTKVVGGITFRRIAEGDLTVADGLGNCLQQVGFEEIVTHEVGHTIGLGHSSENPSEPNLLLRNATMFFLAHLDGRGASLRDDDVAGVSALYPSMTDPNDLDGDGVANASDDCPDTPAGTAVDTHGCGCGEAGHVACDDGLSCTRDACSASTGACVAPPVDCTGGDTCLVGSCDEAAGCQTAPVTGDRAATCAFDRPFPPLACLAGRYPGSAVRRFRHAARKAGTAVVRARTSLAQRAVRDLDRVLAITTRAAARRRRPVASACVDAVTMLVVGARDRLGTWIATH